MKFLQAEKGKYGYINKQKLFEIIKTVVMFACAIGLYLIGFLTLKTNKSLWTIFAVLSVLPAAKCAVSMIMFLRFSSLDKDEYNTVNNASNIPTNYEYVFTSSEKAYFAKAISCKDNTIIVLSNKNDKKDLSSELKNHLNLALEREGLSGYSLKVYTNTDDYVNRLKEMEIKLSTEGDTSYKRVFNLFNAISL